MDRIIPFSTLQQAAQEAYQETKTLTGGENAHYIPFLANIPSSLFALVITLPDGRQVKLGDYDYRFGIESVSKVFTALLILKQWGPQAVLEKIGADATGLSFNSIFAILLEDHSPSTPLVNAGAISACSMVQPQGLADQKWEQIKGNIEALVGSGVEVLEELYASESATNFQNRSITWLLKNYGKIYDDPMMALDLYTRQCSVGITAEQLSVCGATIANRGLNPVSRQQVFEAHLAPKITALITAVGFYQHTGDWIYTSGIPAKTGVGGGVMGVLPGVMGVAAFAPPLDSAGNSVKAQAVIKSLMKKLDLGVFFGDRVVIE